jgi:predicted nucleic acid-binding protein
VTAPSAPRVLLDTCILVAATDARRPESMACTSFIEGRADLCVSSQVLREYAVVATRPTTVNGLGLSLKQALDNIGAICGLVPLLPEDRPLHAVLVELLRAHPVTGKRIHDANLVATAVAHGLAEIATLNTRDFEAFGDAVSLVDPTRG